LACKRREDSHICGLVGIAGKIGVKGEQAFKRMLELDTVRGPHSTGILGVTTTKEPILIKQVGTPWDLYEHKSCEKLFQRNFNILMGHNRWATKGKINRQNAHPFEFPNVIGAHNGTLYNTLELDDRLDFDVDSENLYHHMSNNGVSDTIPRLAGAFALTWYDKKDETLNLIRNKERPFFYAISKDNASLFWASEAWIIQLGANVSGIELGQIQELPIGMLFSFSIPFGVTGELLSKAHIRKMELREEKKPQITGGYNGVLWGPRPVNGNVTPIAGAQVSGKQPRPFSEYQKYIGKTIDFVVGSVGKSESGQAFLHCWASSDEHIALRLFPVPEGITWNLLMDSVNFFKVTIRSYTGIGGGYLTVDMRTLEEVIMTAPGVEEAEEDEYAAGFGGAAITKLEYINATKRGCAWCSSPVEFEDHDSLIWMSKNDFICENCQDFEDVKQYLIN
jgi:predicted glutamine amidotransferase